jgi:Arc/MetJ-type ribon-helix-helix transcriptional regulator
MADARATATWRVSGRALRGLGLNGMLDAGARLAQLSVTHRTPGWYAQRMSQIAVRLSEGELRQLDSVVREAGFRTRAEAVRAGIRMLSLEAREQQISASYARAYAATPLTEDETHMLDAAAALAGELPR